MQVLLTGLITTKIMSFDLNFSSYVHIIILQLEHGAVKYCFVSYSFVSYTKKRTSDHLVL